MQRTATFYLEVALSAGSDLGVALTTVHWPVFTRLKRYFSFLATLSAYGWEHLAPGSVAIATITVTLRLPCFAACGTAFGFVGVASGLEELLFPGSKDERSPTVETHE